MPFVRDSKGRITTTYTYDANGNRASVTYPQTAPNTNTTSSTKYNQFSEPTSTTDELGNTRKFIYDANYNAQNVIDTISGQPATLASFLFYQMDILVQTTKSS